MDIRSISVHIRYSKPLADGSHKTVEISAKGSLAPGEDWHKAEVALYHELGETMKYIFSGNGFGKPALTRPRKAPQYPCEARRDRSQSTGTPSTFAGSTRPRSRNTQRTDAHGGATDRETAGAGELDMARPYSGDCPTVGPPMVRPTCTERSFCR
jgi:hypothetical protein